ncbi:MAG TPA: ABC transporter permease [Gemmatimonadales bacterium]|nr:ABC transporter permease [Gemmatimonadales bacterium]
MTTAVLRFELAAARRGRTAVLFAAGFALASIAIAVVGLSAGGAVAVQGFARTSVSLLQLILWVVPLLALLTGAAAGSECYDVEYIAALPVSRPALVFSRWMAWLITLGAALFVGLGSAGVLIGLLAGTADAPRYVALLAIAVLLVGSCLAIGIAIGVQVRDRGRALALAIVIWGLLVVGVDLLAIGLLALLPAGQATWWLSLLLMANPVDTARALGLGLFTGDVLAGPTGAALRAVMGGWGAWFLVCALAAWTALPLAAAVRTLRRRDL